MRKPPHCGPTPDPVYMPDRIFLNRTLYMRWLFAPLLALSLWFGTGTAASAGEHPPGPDIWFTPNPFTGNGDFLNLWTDDAPWQTAAVKVDALGIVHQSSMVMRAMVFPR